MTDTLQKVRAELAERSGQLRRIADEARVSYDTLLRIRDGETDPGYSKVAAVHRVLFEQKAA